MLLRTSLPVAFDSSAQASPVDETLAKHPIRGRTAGNVHPRQKA